MQLTPHYGTDPVITLDGPPGDVVVPVARQRRRLTATLATLTAEQWASPSRCAGWSCRDVASHLDTTNAFWTFSTGAGLRGEPSRFLATFDPVSSPAQLVEGSADVPAAEVLERLIASGAALVELLESLGDDQWSVLAEAPPGHVSISALAHHALWDAWVHERDILIPLGIEPVVEADEVAACLRYGAALGPAFSRNRGRTTRGTLAVRTTDPACEAVVEIGDHVAVRSGEAPADLTLTGNGVDLLEALSIRRPHAQQVPAETAWMLDGLAETFDALVV